MNSTATPPPSFPFPMVALHLTASTVTVAMSPGLLVGLIEGDACCPVQTPPIRFPVTDNFLQCVLAAHR